MKNKRVRWIVCIVLCVLIVFLLGFHKKNIGPCTEYECDVKNFHIATIIEIDKENEDFAQVKGNLIKFVTDPLTMYDMEDQKTAYAGDAYHFITQDSHTIFVDDEVDVEMVGRFEVLGEEYDIYNINQEKIATVKFNSLGTNGKMYDMNENLIADYNSFIFFNDYEVRITDDCTLDEKTVLMIFASYYSDQAYDSD